MEPFEQTPEDAPTSTPTPIEQMLEESPASTPISPSPGDAVSGSTPPQEDAINRAPTSPEPNGGPLGCCFGVVVGLVLSLSIAILSRLYADQLASLLHSSLSTTVRIVMALFAITAAIVFGYFGWKIGRRVYREYELSPRQQQRLARLQAKHLRRAQRRRRGAMNCAPDPAHQPEKRAQ